MRRFAGRGWYPVLVGALVLAVTGLTAGNAPGVSRSAPGAVLDQKNPWRAATCKYWGWAPDDSSGYAAQTFTAGTSGALADVVLPLKGTTDQITVAIAPVDASGKPVVGSPLASTTVPFSKPATLTSIDVLLPSRPNVTAGKQYAIVVSSATESTSTYVGWGGDIGSTYGDDTGARCADGAYAGGRAWSVGTAPLGTDADFFFETYVAPAASPQPVTPAKPATGAISVRSIPATPLAGAAFTVRAVAPKSIKCAAKLAGLPLKGSGTGGCTFQIPKTAGGQRLTVTVTALSGGKTKTKALGYVVRSPSPPSPLPTTPSTPTPTTPAPAPPIAQAGHYAGTTPGGAQVRFDVTSDGRYITNISFGFHLACSPSGTVDNPGLSVLPTIRFGIHSDGTFTALTNTTINFTDARVTVTFDGRFTGPGSAAGTLALRLSITQAGVVYDCGPLSDTWTATRS